MRNPRRTGDEFAPLSSPSGEGVKQSARQQITVIAEFFVASAAENVRDLRRMAGMPPRWSPAPLAREVADIFIPLTRNENSAMTVGGGGGRGLFHTLGAWERQEFN